MSKVKEPKETPLMKQYNAAKTKYPGSLLLFRVGDFYETFGKDAVEASRILDIVLTKRANGAASHIELAGFPHHALDSYLPKLVRAGYRVAICDQLEDPKTAKGIVKRGVTELVTPGVSFNENVLSRNHNNYLASIYWSETTLGIAFLDISTGEFLVSSGDKANISRLLESYDPAEIITSKSAKERISDILPDNVSNFFIDDWVFQHQFGYDMLIQQFNTQSLKGFGIELLSEAIIAAGAILHYLNETEHKELSHISSISRIDESKYVWIDQFTARNLELAKPAQEDGVSLLDIIDKTSTPMGARMIKKWLLLPLKEKKSIQNRQNIVEALLQDPELSQDLIGEVSNIHDLERLISKVAVKRVNPRELLQLGKSLSRIGPVKDMLLVNDQPAIKQLSEQLDYFQEIIEKLDLQLEQDLPINISLGGVIRSGVNEELDELRKIAFSGKDYLVQIQQREAKKTGISSLKIAYNRVFGYYLEVTHTHKDKVPQEWIRKQTLVNAERYVTQELKEYEEKILGAEDEIKTIELGLFNKLVDQIGLSTSLIQENAHLIARLDCLLSFAQLAARYNYIKPEILDKLSIKIKKGRHPVIERELPTGEEYIPNDVFCDNETQQILIITGPNMAGKSALLRQTALIVILAQIGSFVPAESAELGLVDKVFTRVGASDNLSRGESTFMVEMIETASILNNLSDRSLLLMDEIGRGTSTYDGVSIAWSIVEYLHNHRAKPKTLFATHYHELNQLTSDFPRVKNFNVSVKEIGDKILFLRKLIEGGSEHSFGIHVAQLAGMPNQIVLRANEILKFLEKDKQKNKDKEKFTDIPKGETQMLLFKNDPRFEKIVQLINELDINTISPVEALLKLNEIKQELKNEQKD